MCVTEEHTFLKHPLGPALPCPNTLARTQTLALYPYSAAGTRQWLGQVLVALQVPGSPHVWCVVRATSQCPAAQAMGGTHWHPGQPSLLQGLPQDHHAPASQ